MTENAMHDNRDSSSPASMHFRFERVGKIALYVGVAGGAGLLGVLYLLSDNSATSYAQITIAHSLASRNLGPALLVFGLVMVTFAGIVTWLISLYSSFRVAGPLFRFARNLELAIDRSTNPFIAIRRTDHLQAEWQQFQAGMSALRGHYDALRRATDGVARALEAGPAAPAQALTEAIGDLREIESRVEL
jgi:hypothetical protein